MKVFYDSNVILDVLLTRQEFLQDSMKALKFSELKVVKGYISASSITDLYYIIKRNLKDSILTVEKIKVLAKIVKIATVKENTIKKAINSGWNDFEDSVQFYVAKDLNVNCIVTRNKKDFSNSNIKIFTPSEFIEYMNK